jgi:hypothetical protein
MDLRPVNRDHPNPRQPRPSAQPQHLTKQARQRRLVALDEPRDRRVIRALLRRHDPKGDVLDAGALDHTRRPDPTRVGVKQQRDHHRPLIGRPAAAITAIGRIERLQLHLLDRRQHEPRQMILRQPLPNIRRHQKRLLTITRDEALTHCQMVLNPPDNTRLTRQPRVLAALLAATTRCARGEPSSGAALPKRSSERLARRRLPVLVHPSSERTVEPVRQDSSFAEKQESHPAL